MIWTTILRAIIGPLVKLLAILGLRWDAKRDARRESALEAAEDRGETLSEIRRHEMEAATQDDPRLVNRLTRPRKR